MVQTSPSSHGAPGKILGSSGEQSSASQTPSPSESSKIPIQSQFISYSSSMVQISPSSQDAPGKIFGSEGAQSSASHTPSPSESSKIPIQSQLISFYKKLLDIAGQLKDTNRLTVYYNNIGIAYFKMKDFGKSESSLRKSLEFKRKSYSKYSPTLISNYSNLALVNIWMEKYEEADEYYHTLLKIVTKTYGELHIRNARTYANLGTSLYFQKKFEQALECFQKAQKISAALDKMESLESAEEKKMIAKCYIELKEFELAKTFLNESLKIRRSKNSQFDDSQIETNVLLASIYHSENKNHLYNTALNRAYTNIKYDVRDPYNFENLEVPTSLFYILRLNISTDLEKLYVNDTSIVKNIEINLTIADSLSQFIKYRYDDIESRRKLISQLKWVYEAHLSFHYLMYQIDCNLNSQQVLNCFERSKNIFLYEKIAESNSEELINFPEQLINEKKRFLDTITYYNRQINDTSNGDLTENYSKNLSKLNRAKDSLNLTLTKIKQSHPQYYSKIYQPNHQDIREIQNSLNENCYELNYFYGDDIYILLIGKNEIHLSKLEDSGSLNCKINDFHHALHSKDNETCLREYGFILYETLIPEKIQNIQCELNIIPDGNLAILPFEVLTDNNGVFLFESKKISYKYSHNSNLNKTPRIENVLAMAPVFLPGEDNKAKSVALQNVTRNEPGHLPQSELEVKNVGRLFNTKPLLHSEATEDNFKALAPKMDIIHLATHGVIDNKNPNNTRLYFNKNNISEEDGLLYSNEIAGMNLKADLVTLSACNTGTGKQHLGEGIESLGRAFAYAGCMNQLLSLWPVNDNSTQQIMSHFYQNLKDGYGKAAALQKAKKQYLNESPSALRHPYYWAGLVYYGDDTPLNIKNDKITDILLLGFSLISLSLLLYFSRKKTSLSNVNFHF